MAAPRQPCLAIPPRLPAALVGLACLGLLLGAQPMPAAAQTFSLGGRNDFATGPTPYSVAIADVNGDGRPDMVVANYTSGIASVLLGNGAGGFGAKSDFATGLNPTSVAIGELSGDGSPCVSRRAPMCA